MKKKFMAIMLGMAMFFSFGAAVAAPQAALAATNEIHYVADVTNLNQNIYNDTGDNQFAKKIENIVKIVAGTGAILFVLAVLIISALIIFGSISAGQAGTYWKALFSCIAGAFVFFSAYSFAPTIAKFAFN